MKAAAVPDDDDDGHFYCVDQFEVRLMLIFCFNGISLKLS